MSQVKISGNASGTGILTVAAPNTNSNYTLTLPAETGTVLTSASSITQNAGPAFLTYMSAGQTISSNTWTKIQYNTEVLDTNSCYDTSNYRFTPNVAGVYILNFGFRLDTTTAYEYWIQVYKNGSSYKVFYDIQVQQYQMTGSVLAQANGSTDYFEMYFFQNSGSNKTSSFGATNAFFDGCLLRAV